MLFSQVFSAALLAAKATSASPISPAEKREPSKLHDALLGKTYHVPGQHDGSSHGANADAQDAIIIKILTAYRDEGKYLGGEPQLLHPDAKSAHAAVGETSDAQDAIIIKILTAYNDEGEYLGGEHQLLHPAHAGAGTSEATSEQLGSLLALLGIAKE